MVHCIDTKFKKKLCQGCHQKYIFMSFNPEQRLLRYYAALVIKFDAKAEYRGLPVRFGLIGNTLALTRTEPLSVLATVSLRAARDWWRFETLFWLL